MRNEHLLPRRVQIDHVFALLDEIRNRPNNKEEEMRKWVKELDRSKHALTQWGLVDDASGRLALTKKGEAVAWSNGRERDDLLLQHVVLGYEPYAVLMTHHLKAWNPVLTTDDVLPIWAKNLGVTLSRGDMSTSAATMFGLMEKAGLGRYLIGRAGKSTRIEFNADAAERVRAMSVVAATNGVAPPTVPKVEDRTSPASARGNTEEPSPMAVEVKLAASRAIERNVRNYLAHGGNRGPLVEDADEAVEGFEVYRRPGLEIKVRPTPENIARGIQFLQMLLPETKKEPADGDAKKAASAVSPAAT